ncbi:MULTISPECIES: hypothetical protein [Bradyrhizobium]|uniref:hypothetical protein n=1 Tax=Bradyrhizobium TaxID=374 RepID=UPI0004140BB7|nr:MULTISPECIES: hypothetical protein [Bradyrhizobium]
MTNRTRPTAAPAVSRLGLALAALQEKRGQTLRSMAAEIGTTASSLQRIMKRGQLPDALGMTKILMWLTEPFPKADGKARKRARSA